MFIKVLLQDPRKEDNHESQENIVTPDSLWDFFQVSLAVFETSENLTQMITDKLQNYHTVANAIFLSLNEAL